jgi:hypothetical protein
MCLGWVNIPCRPAVRLIDYLMFYVPIKNISLIWRNHHCRWRAAKFRPMLGAQGHWAGRDIYRATPAVTRDLGFPGLIRRTTPFCDSVASYDTQGMWRIYYNPDPHGSPVPWSWMRSYPLSNPVCQVRSNYWYEKCLTTYGSMKVCNYELDHCNGHRACEKPTSNVTVEIPVS